MKPGHHGTSLFVGRAGRPWRWRLGLMILFGLLVACAVPEDPWAALSEGQYAEAWRLWEPQAEAGSTAAQNALGTLAYLGLGVPRDYTVARTWFEKAALAGDAHAQRNLGSLFRHGHGAPRDDFRAFGWYEQSLRTGNRRAEEYLRMTALSVGWNQQALARRTIEEDMRLGRVSLKGGPSKASTSP
ncbi:MAG: hypothetical protein FJ164_13645 [Gammaproteobacteria bacterium]|nr:hypothetical protein [Gammaproteobacteria bacterium]